MTDLNDQYPLYKPQVESLEDYITLITSGDISFVVPLIMAGLLTWLVLTATKGSDK